MMERMLRTYFWWKGGLGDMSRNLRGADRPKRLDEGAGGGQNNGKGSSGQPAYKRRRVRGGSVAASMSGRSKVKVENGKEGEVGEGDGERLEDENIEIADLSVIRPPISD